MRIRSPVSPRGSRSKRRLLSSGRPERCGGGPTAATQTRPPSAAWSPPRPGSRCGSAGTEARPRRGARRPPRRAARRGPRSGCSRAGTKRRITTGSQRRSLAPPKFSRSRTPSPSCRASGTIAARQPTSMPVAVTIHQAAAALNGEPLPASAATAEASANTANARAARRSRTAIGARRGIRPSRSRLAMAVGEFGVAEVTSTMGRASRTARGVGRPGWPRQGARRSPAC